MRNRTVSEMISETIKTETDAIEAVKQNGFALEDIPFKFVTQAVCLVAVKENGYALRLVPHTLRILDVCLTATRRNKNAFEYVPNELKKQVREILQKKMSKKKGKEVKKNHEQ